MSIQLMTLAWQADYQAGKKMVLLALCDNANDQGECFPSISMLAEKCSMSERSVFNHVASLESDGAIKRINRPGRSTVYHIDPCKFCTPADAAPLQILHTTPADSASPPLQPLHTTPATISPTPATVAPITIKEPSTSSLKQKRGTKFDAASVDLPEWLDAELWARWVRDRATRGKAITEDGARLQIAKLKGFYLAGFSIETAINQSIENGWAGLFEPKGGKGATPAARATSHSGLSTKNYSEGVNADGSFA